MLNHAKKSNAGQKLCDVVLMFKIMLFKRYYNLSDKQAEFSCRAKAVWTKSNQGGKGDEL
jgi:hypothetical protein